MINLTLAQLNFTVGDLKGNREKIQKVIKEVAPYTHLLVFPELALSGYPPEDLLTQRHFVKEVMEELQELVRFTRNYELLVAVGSPYYEGDLYNGLLLLYRGRVVGKYFKSYLPNYSVFDEIRYFRRGDSPLLVKLNDYLLVFSICEDIWYPDGVEREGVLSGAELIVNVNASPYHLGKYSFKESFLKARAEDNLCFVAYLNTVGGQDELVFDGRSLVLSPGGEIVARAKAFEEDLLSVSLDLEEVRRKRLVDLRWREASSRFSERREPATTLSVKKEKYLKPRLEKSPESEEELYRAITLGLRDYTRKNGFGRVVLGLSGGIDSSLVCVLAADALGKEAVVGVYMPSQFSSRESYEDAHLLARRLGIEFHVVSIQEIYRAYFGELEKTLCELSFDVADENLQARIRANLLFYFSNKFGYLVLATSNKSETAVGYTTIYGDMAGGYAPIKDLYKTWVYRLARYRNNLEPVIPERVFTKPPSAELRPNQTDQDTLPPYDVLDGILFLYLELGLSPEEIVKRGYDRGVVQKVIRMIRRNEYKRKQAPVGPKLTGRAFGKDWRMPITNLFKL